MKIGISLNKHFDIQGVLQLLDSIGFCWKTGKSLIYHVPKNPINWLNVYLESELIGNGDVYIKKYCTFSSKGSLEHLYHIRDFEQFIKFINIISENPQDEKLIINSYNKLCKNSL